MYTVAVKRDFIAQHYLVGGDWGKENYSHSHHYVIELQLEGEELNQNEFLVDIVDIELELDEVMRRYRDQALNEHQEFSGVNPSLEYFAKILCQELANKIQAPNIQFITVKLWENEIAWASFRMEH